MHFSKLSPMRVVIDLNSEQVKAMLPRLLRKELLDYLVYSFFGGSEKLAHHRHTKAGFRDFGRGRKLLRNNGEPSRARTCDPLIKSQLLYQLSYRPTSASELYVRNKTCQAGVVTRSSRCEVAEKDWCEFADNMVPHL